MRETPLRFLLVDDSGEDRLLTRLIFKRHGLANPIEEVETAAAALQRLNDRDAPPIDVLLLDALLPDLPGEEVARRVADTPHLAHVAVIILSALGEGAMKAPPGEMVRGVLQKPLPVDTMLRILHKSLASQVTVTRA